MFSLSVIFIASSSSARSATASTPLAATRSASSSTKATNSSDLATKSVSERSCDDGDGAVGGADGDGALGRLAVGPLGLAGQALLAEPGDGLVHVAVVLLEAHAWRRACPTPVS